MNHIIPAAKIISRYYFAFCVLFGFYLMAHGHISHGAGLIGGIIISLGFLQVPFVSGKSSVSNIINKTNAKILAVSGILGMLSLYGFVYFYGQNFIASFMTQGNEFELLSSGITPLFNGLLCLSATGCLLLIILSVLDSESKE